MTKFIIIKIVKNLERKKIKFNKFKDKIRK
jgi:hypothetical protein